MAGLVKVNGKKKVIMNMNSMIKVTLTNDGKRHLALHEQIYTKPPVSPLTADSDGTLRLPLWQVMQIFGAHMHQSRSDLPFIDNQIEVMVG